MISEELVPDADPDAENESNVQFEFIFLANKVRQSINQDQISYPSPVPYIVSASQSGLILLKFTTPLKEGLEEINI